MLPAKQRLPPCKQPKTFSAGLQLLFGREIQDFRWHVIRHQYWQECPRNQASWPQRNAKNHKMSPKRARMGSSCNPLVSDALRRAAHKRHHNHLAPGDFFWSCRKHTRGGVHLMPLPQSGSTIQPRVGGFWPLPWEHVTPTQLPTLRGLHQHFHTLRGFGTPNFLAIKSKPASFLYGSISFFNERR